MTLQITAKNLNLQLIFLHKLRSNEKIDRFVKSLFICKGTLNKIICSPERSVYYILFVLKFTRYFYSDLQPRKFNGYVLYEHKQKFLRCKIKMKFLY